MSTTRITSWVAAVLMISAIACGGQSEKTPVVEPSSPAQTTTSAEASGVDGISLAGRTFFLVGSSGHKFPDNSKVRIDFTDTTLSFHCGCNTQTGAYRTEGGTLIVSVQGMATSLMACLPELEAQDSWMRDFLISKPTIAIDGNDLVIKNASASLSFQDRVVVDPDRPLVGQQWNIDILITGPASSSAGESTASIQFMPDGNLALDTGCNKGSGKYEVSGSELTFTGVALTRRACLSDAISKTENHILKVVNPGTATYRIEASRLTIERADGSGVGAAAQ